jgi:hypothetical protein
MPGSRRSFRLAGVVVAAVVLSLPIGALVTLLLLPFWRWLESTYGIESVGHSGPGDWCYTASTVAVALVLLPLFLVFTRRREPSGKVTWPF